jgi:UDP-N-acetyl-D-glucosamine/UDP-N-acetyl-D-galactosamine dehydrogenase
MIEQNKISIAVIGLGYVGLPLAVEFSKKFPVVGFDLNTNRINELKRGKDRTREINSSELNKNESLLLSDSHSCLKDSNVYIVTVPTPVDKNKTPNLDPLESASKTIGKYLKKGDVVIYESTVYPGATEEICVPILEEVSNLVYNKDFYCGYSPERINPGDKKHTLVNIKKITSGSNSDTASFIEMLYSKIIRAGIFSASSIKVAEAAKVIENTQRDVNIALINELALIFNKLNIDTSEVLEAAGTKWNFLPFKPGLVGGHCIGVDPYYLTYKAIEVGYHPEIILAGRKINDSMGKFIADKTILGLIENKVSPENAKIAIFGLTFKEDCPDLRNTKVIDIIDNLNKYNLDIIVTDSKADKKEALSIYNLNLTPMEQIRGCDAVIIAVPHEEYLNFRRSNWNKILKKKSLIIDVKSVYSTEDFIDRDCSYLRL